VGIKAVVGLAGDVGWCYHDSCNMEKSVINVIVVEKSRFMQRL
jgi:hypothetical protein